MTDEDRRLRSKVISQGKRRIDKQLKNGTYLDMLREENGLTDEKDNILSEEFLFDSIKDIERSRERKLVYDKDYQRQSLDEWLREKEKKSD